MILALLPGPQVICRWQCCLLCAQVSSLEHFAKQAVSNDADVICKRFSIMLICNDTCVCINAKNSLPKRFDAGQLAQIKPTPVFQTNLNSDLLGILKEIPNKRFG